jgi:aminoglycoside phosphotransferase (APT) family kinase protein
MSVDDPSELGSRLSRLLDDAPVDALTRLSGGASRETWRFRAGDEWFVLQRQRGGSPRDMSTEVAALRAAHAAAVPVAEVVTASSDPVVLGAPFMVVRAVDGETIARKILRDDEFADARAVLVGQLGAALGRLHAIDPAAVPGLATDDQLAYYRRMLDDLGQPHPTFELAFRWLEANRPATSRTTVVHGDFRLGNVVVGDDGLRAVLDWELAHLGDPMEDLGWLCVKAWRFGSPLRVAGVGTLDQLLDAYAEAAGVRPDPEVVRWWEVLGTLKWGVMCIMQAEAHRSGLSRSHELAAIGRRVCENEYDLFLLLDEVW